MKRVKCIKDFLLDKCDDGFTIGNDYIYVEEGTIWDIEEDTSRVIGGQIRLTNDDLGWLEISNETFEEYFQIIN